MSKASRVSAFAKRRRLNDGSVISSAESDTSGSSKPIKPLKTQKHFQKSASPSPSPQRVLAVKDVANDDSAGGNAFEPLIHANVVKFTGTREIEQIDDSAYKIRLSRGQKCCVQGIAQLWVRDGSIFVLGAHLFESTETHTLFADVPSEIEASSKTAEFQLEAIAPSDAAYPSALNVPGKLGREARSGQMSFRIIDLEADSVEDDLAPGDHVPAIRSISSHDKNIAKVVQKQKIRNKKAGPRIMICGKRASQTSRAAGLTINHVLTTKEDAEDAQHVLFLDLDPSVPLFSCPGTISLARLCKPVFGPVYAYPLQVGCSSEGVLLASYYMGTSQDWDSSKLSMEIIEKLVQAGKDFGSDALIVRIGQWLGQASARIFQRLQELLSPNLVLSIERSKSSPYHEMAVVLSEHNQLLHLPGFLSIPTSSLSEHRYALQSHFWLHQYVDGQPLWFQHTSKARPGNDTISFGEIGACITFVIVRGGVLRAQDLSDALSGALVSVVATARLQHPTSNGGNGIIANELALGAELIHVGLAFVEHVDEVSKTITISGPLTVKRLTELKTNQLEIGLVLEKPGIDGRFGRHLLHNE